MIKKITGGLTLLSCVLMTVACKNEVLPKPAGQLRLEYPLAEYAHFSSHCPFEFDMNEKAVIKEKKDCDFTINYPKMKATIYLTYKPVNGNRPERCSHAAIKPPIAPAP